jgi:hypothetical protein
MIPLTDELAARMSGMSINQYLAYKKKKKKKKD